MIHVVATIHLKPGARDRFLEAFHRLVPQVLAEDGCMAYGPAVDVDVRPHIPIAAEPRIDAVTVIEQWASVPALKAHLEAPHMDRYRQEVGELVESLDLRVYQPA